MTTGDGQDRGGERAPTPWAPHATWGPADDGGRDGAEISPLRVHVVYEYDMHHRPHASAWLRLLRPLSHPALGVDWAVTFDADYEGQKADVVIVDRLWRPDVSPALAERLVDRVRRAGARLVLALDDNLLDLADERPDWPTPDHVRCLELWLDAAAGVLVTTEPLAERYSPHNANVRVVPNALDERLLVPRHPPTVETPFGRRPVTVGYMGTATHDADLRLVLPVLGELARRMPGRVELEMVGVTGDPSAVPELADLGVRVRDVFVHEREYPLFMPWLTGSLRWDVAIAPLVDTPFSRGKSDVKFLDYAALGAAGVFSRRPAYEGTVRDGETGLLVADDVSAWVDALESLVEDDGRRREMALAAGRHLLHERTLAVCAPRWAEAVRGMVEG